MGTGEFHPHFFLCYKVLSGGKMEGAELLGDDDASEARVHRSRRSLTTFNPDGAASDVSPLVEAFKGCGFAAISSHRPNSGQCPKLTTSAIGALFGTVVLQPAIFDFDNSADAPAGSGGMLTVVHAATWKKLFTSPLSHLQSFQRVHVPKESSISFPDVIQNQLSDLNASQPTDPSPATAATTGSQDVPKFGDIGLCAEFTSQRHRSKKSPSTFLWMFFIDVDQRDVWVKLLEHTQSTTLLVTLHQDALLSGEHKDKDSASETEECALQSPERPGSAEYVARFMDSAADEAHGGRAKNDVGDAAAAPNKGVCGLITVKGTVQCRISVTVDQKQSRVLKIEPASLVQRIVTSQKTLKFRVDDVEVVPASEWGKEFILRTSSHKPTEIEKGAVASRRDVRLLAKSFEEKLKWLRWFERLRGITEDKPIDKAADPLGLLQETERDSLINNKSRSFLGTVNFGPMFESMVVGEETSQVAAEKEEESMQWRRKHCRKLLGRNLSNLSLQSVAKGGKRWKYRWLKLHPKRQWYEAAFARRRKVESLEKFDILAAAATLRLVGSARGL